MIKLQRLGHILVNVRDLERSKAFYTRILGFTVLEQDPDHGGLFLSIGNYGNTLDIFQSTNPDAAAQSKSQLGNREGMGVRHIAFAVETEEDLKQAYFALQDAGEWLNLDSVTTPLFAGEMGGKEWAQLGTAVAVWVLLPLTIGTYRVLKREVK